MSFTAKGHLTIFQIREHQHYVHHDLTPLTQLVRPWEEIASKTLANSLPIPSQVSRNSPSITAKWGVKQNSADSMAKQMNTILTENRRTPLPNIPWTTQNWNSKFFQQPGCLVPTSITLLWCQTSTSGLAPRTLQRDWHLQWHLLHITHALQRMALHQSEVQWPPALQQSLKHGVKRSEVHVGVDANPNSCVREWCVHGTYNIGTAVSWKWAGAIYYSKYKIELNSKFNFF